MRVLLKSACLLASVAFGDARIITIEEFGGTAADHFSCLTMGNELLFLPWYGVVVLFSLLGVDSTKPRYELADWLPWLVVA